MSSIKSLKFHGDKFISSKSGRRATCRQAKTKIKGLFQFWLRIHQQKIQIDTVLKGGIEPQRFFKTFFSDSFFLSPRPVIPEYLRNILRGKVVF